MAQGDTVLVVDDDAISRSVLTRALQSGGFETEVLSSGAAALSWLAENTPAVILLDLVMPPPDGYVILRAIRRDRRTAEVPVVVLTALDRDEEVARAFELGADDFIRKPFRPVELIARVRSQIRMREYVVALARKEHDAKVVLELTQALSSALDIRNILFTVVRRIAEVARVDRCSIILVHDKGDVGYVVASSDDKDLRDLPLDLSRYPEIQNVLATGQVLVIEDARSSPVFDLIRASLPPDAFRSVAILPILFEDKPMGVLFLRGRRPVALREHELSLARTVASATAIALRNARILQSLRDQTQQINVARFEAERRLAALQPYADFFHSAADGIVVIDPDGRILFSNSRAQAITNRSDAELASMTLASLIDPRDYDRVEELRACFGRGDFPHMVDLTIQRTHEAYCERRVLSCSFSSVLREDGGAILVSFHDVTSERATEAELTKTKEFLERVIESSVDAIVSADMNGLLLLFNRAAERIFGYEAREVVGTKTIRDLYPEGNGSHIMDLIRSEEHGGPGRLEGYRTEVLAKDGTRIPMMLSAALILEGGAPTGSVGIFTDLRDLVHMETQLTAAQEELRHREKQALIAELAGAAAHELNQPLTSVLGYAEMILRRVDASSPACAAAQTIRGEAERMAEIVRKIGKITRYETKSYVGSARIIDLDRSSDGSDGSGRSSG
ncbi:PAS domain S-box protein [Chondromyces apiculatus]|uniref:histidine kinase n=1 Tax=Chondromyces apiculatus DSM 436 TaxID=1192034 RepID=A0A017T9A3_9BACT|nr:PAS domain S-box protein [Chondromyces apiculatus]EYF05853.1 sensory transduction histidine kinase [Chondromyces apiculatus DSM 436]